MAAARVGTAFASKEIIALFNKVKPPYNISKLNQDAALIALDNLQDFEKNKIMILAQKVYLKTALSEIKFIKKIYPSDANFLLVEVDDADKIYNALVNEKVITRNRNNVVKNCIRITVGSEAENIKLLKVMKEL